MARTVSNTYKSIMSKDYLPMTHFRITFGIEAPNAQGEAVFTTPLQAPWSDVEEINDENMPTSNYASCELNQYILGSGATLFPDNASEYVKDKFASVNTSNVECEYPSDKLPTINIQFTTLQTLAGLTFFFDSINKTYPTSMRITGLDGTTVKKTELCSPTGYNYISPSFENIRALKIEILKSNLPMARNIISRIYFGIVKVFTEADAEKVEQTYSLSPINNNLYKSEFKVALDNFDLQYNIDNKQGIYTYLTEQQPIKVEYSMDGTEWISSGEYLTSGKAKIQNNIATIESIDQIQFMNDQYKKDVYRTTPISLYNLAYAILVDFGWESNDKGEYPFEIDDSLKNITTLGTLPATTYAECLQIIASAGCVALYVDDRGYICLKPLPTTVADTDYIIDFRQSSTFPTPEEIEPLSQVDVTVHSYTVKATEEEIHKATYTVNGSTTLKIDYDFSTGQSATAVTGLTINSSRFYGRYCELDVTGTGTFEIIIKGKKIEDGTSVTSIINQEAGEVAPLDNPLIMDSTRATVIGTFTKNYLKQRIRYTIPWVQDYRVNVGDLVKVKTQFSEELICRVVEIKTSEPALVGSMKVVVQSA